MLLEEIQHRWADSGVPFSNPVIRSGRASMSLEDIARADVVGAQGLAPVLEAVPPGAVVAHIGDFTPWDIVTLLRLIDRNCIIAPLTESTSLQHEQFFAVAGAEWVIRRGGVGAQGLAPLQRRPASQPPHPLVAELNARQAPGLVLFSSGTTSAPKAALHDFSRLLDKFRSYRRPALATLAFLLFDHIGGLNTLFHSLFNAGTIHIPASRQPTAVMRQVAESGINLVPTTPSFLRLALVEGAFDGLDLSRLKLVTYGTERMDQPTLDRLNGTLPDHVDIRQTYGMSELGIFPVKNYSKRQLWIRIADPNIEIEARDGVLWVRSPQRMLGYLNAHSPFDEAGWFNTRDLVEFGSDGYFRILGRTDEVINVGGVKVHPREVEEAAHTLAEVCYAKAHGEADPFLGQHIRLDVELVDGVSMTKAEFRARLSRLLDRERMPHRIEFQKVPITARFKRG